MASYEYVAVWPSLSETSVKRPLEFVHVHRRIARGIGLPSEPACRVIGVCRRGAARVDRGDHPAVRVIAVGCRMALRIGHCRGAFRRVVDVTRGLAHWVGDLGHRSRSVVTECRGVAARIGDGRQLAALGSENDGLAERIGHAHDPAELVVHCRGRRKAVGGLTGHLAREIHRAVGERNRAIQGHAGRRGDQVRSRPDRDIPGAGRGRRRR